MPPDDDLREKFARHADRQYRKAKTDDEEDAIGEATLTGLRKLNQLKEPEALSGWFATIRSRIFWSQSTKNRKFVLSGDIDRLADQAINPDDGEKYQELHRAIQALPPKQREVIVRHFLMEQPYKEISDALGIDEGALRGLQFRGLRSLTKALILERTNP